MVTLQRRQDPVPGGVRQTDSTGLRGLAEEAVQARFNARWDADALTGLAADGTHHIMAIMWHYRRIEDPPHLRCAMVAAMNDGARAFATIDVLEESFAGLTHVTDPSVTREQLLANSGPTLLTWLELRDRRKTDGHELIAEGDESAV